ncbi:hypothetical protein GCM10020220_092690 [Nonomuraea rubra]|uniref:hypothetical protein n=1 Tax=Nonomuraea rubra TaxID=46180 RepID=UPI0031E7984C
MIAGPSGHAASSIRPPARGRPPALRRAIEQALAQAGLEPGDLDVVFADAAGSPDLDRAEAEAIAAVFGDRGVPVTAPKTMTGRLYAGGPSLDVATALMAMRHSVLPPTIGVFDLVHRLRDRPGQGRARARGGAPRR